MRKKTGVDSENSESEQITVGKDEPEIFLRRGPCFTNESQQDSDAPTSRKNRVNRPPVRIAIEDFIKKRIMKLDFGHDSSR